MQAVVNHLGPRLDRVLGVSPLPDGDVLDRPASHAPIHSLAEELTGHGVRDLQGRLALSRERIFP